MKKLNCTNCGAGLIKDEDGDYHCEHCGSTFVGQKEKKIIYIQNNYYKTEDRDTKTVSPSSTVAFTRKKVRASVYVTALIIVVMAILCSVLIPMAVIRATPQEITYHVSTGGYLLVNGEIYENSYTCELNEDDSIIVQAVPYEHYSFSGWKDDYTYESDNSTATREDFKDGTKARSYTAYFSLDSKYTLKYLAGTGGYISGTTTQSVWIGESGTEVTAIANTGYLFNGWSDGVSTASRTDTNVYQNKTVTANFKVTYNSGDGTESNPYIIANMNQFMHFVSNNKSSEYYKLATDLNFEEVSSLTFNGMNFSGHLDGGGHTISNLSKSSSQSFSAAKGRSLFNTLSSAEIKNLNIKNCEMRDAVNKESYRGALAKKITGNTKIINCNFTNISLDVTSNSNLNVGVIAGLIDSNSNVTIQNCTVNDFTVSTNNDYSTYIGGLVGYIKSGCTITLSDNTVTEASAVTFANLNVRTFYVGGLVGYSQTSQSNITLTSNSSSFKTTGLEYDYGEYSDIVVYQDSINY